MKKNIIRMLMTAVAVWAAASCNYLDVVPDEMPTDKDAFADQPAAERYLYSCYGYLPNPRAGASSLDFMTGDEVITAFEHETFAAFPKGNYSSSNPVISYWNSFFTGLRQCHLFLSNLDQVPNLESDLRADYEGQAKFLVAYYHYLLIQCYGPTIVIDKVPDVNASVENYLARTPLDECVEFVCNLFDEAAALLPASRTNVYYGLATSVAAKALKAKMLLFAASPLFNGQGGNSWYADFTNNDGTPLMPTTYDASKWTRCKEAMEEAVRLAEANGYALYQETDYNTEGSPAPADPVQHKLRYTIMHAANPEIIWADTRDEGIYGLQNKSMPYSASSAWNGVAPTWAMLSRFYTENGLPWDEDPAYKNLNKTEVVTIPGDSEVACPGQRTIRFNLGREPRFYAWIGFQGGYYEISNAMTSGAYTNDPSYDEEERRLVCDFAGDGLGNGNCARGTRTNDYSPSGYLNKKGIMPSYQVSTSLNYAPHYPWPIVRLADLYLGLAEAAVETNDLDVAKTYLNKVRTRAGIPDVETSWAGVASLSQGKLRDIVRQERMVEFYLENQNFWDMRRWLLAGQYFNVQAQGMNTEANNVSDFSRLTTIIFERKFQTPMNYLLPLPTADLNNNPNLVNNPGY